jgi:hypothetical protein
MPGQAGRLRPQQKTPATSRAPVVFTLQEQQETSSKQENAFLRRRTVCTDLWAELCLLLWR